MEIVKVMKTSRIKITKTKITKIKKTKLKTMTTRILCRNRTIKIPKITIKTSKILKVTDKRIKLHKITTTCHTRLDLCKLPLVHHSIINSNHLETISNKVQKKTGIIRSRIRNNKKTKTKIPPRVMEMFSNHQLLLRLQTIIRMECRVLTLINFMRDNKIVMDHQRVKEKTKILIVLKLRI